MASPSEESPVGPPESGFVFVWPDITDRADSKLEVRYFIGESRYVAFLLDFNDFWFNGRYQYFKFDGHALDRNELAILCGQDEADKLRREPGRKLKAYVPSQSNWVALRTLRETHMKQQQQQLLQQQEANSTGGRCAAINSDSERQKRAKLYEEYITEEKQQQQQQQGTGGYSSCRELTVPKEWARDEFKNREFPLQIKLQVRLNGVLLPEQYEVKVSRDNRQDRASRRYRIALTSGLRELGDIVQASRYITEWRRMSEELIVISVNNTGVVAPTKVVKEEARDDSNSMWDDEAAALAIAAEDTRSRPSTRARTLKKAMGGGQSSSPSSSDTPDLDEPVPGLRDMLGNMWADQQAMTEQHLADTMVLEERKQKMQAEHEAKVIAMQQDHHAQLTKLQSKQQQDMLRVVQRQYADSANQRNGQVIDQYRCELQLMNEKHGAQMGKLASKQEAELQALLEKQQQELRKLQERISRLEAEHHLAAKGMLLRHQDAVCSRVERHHMSMQDEWQRCFHLEEEEAAVTLASLACRSTKKACTSQALNNAAVLGEGDAEVAGHTPRAPDAAAAAAAIDCNAEQHPDTQQAEALQPQAHVGESVPSPTQPAATPQQHHHHHHQQQQQLPQPRPPHHVQPAPAAPSAAACGPSILLHQHAEPSSSRPTAAPQPRAAYSHMHSMPHAAASQPMGDLYALRPEHLARILVSDAATSSALQRHHLDPSAAHLSLRDNAVGSSTSSPSLPAATPFTILPSMQHHPSAALHYNPIHHQAMLERYASSPSCTPSYDHLRSCNPTHTTTSMLTAPIPVQTGMPGEVQPASGSDPSQKRTWPAPSLGQLPDEGLEPPIKRPHKLIVKMVHA